MAKLIIEELNRLGHCTERHQFLQLPVRIGRGYNNDLIISDPHVSPDHLVVHESEHGWRIEDCDSLNGVHIKHHNGSQSATQLSSGDDLIIGHTRLRFYAPEHTVAETHCLIGSKEYGNKQLGNKQSTPLLSRPVFAIVILLLTLGAMVTNQMLVSTTKVGIEKLIASVLPAVVGALFWAGIWAFVGRVTLHRTNYTTQLSISVLFMLAIVLINNLTDYITFMTSSNIIAQGFGYLLTGIAVFILLYVNIENATAISRRARMMTSHAITWSLILFALFMEYAGQPDFTYVARFPSMLKPPFAHITRSLTQDEYLKKSETIFNVEKDK